MQHTNVVLYYYYYLKYIYKAPLHLISRVIYVRPAVRLERICGNWFLRSDHNGKNPTLETLFLLHLSEPGRLLNCEKEAHRKHAFDAGANSRQRGLEVLDGVRHPHVNSSRADPAGRQYVGDQKK